MKIELRDRYKKNNGYIFNVHIESYTSATLFYRRGHSVILNLVESEPVFFHPDTTIKELIIFLKNFIDEIEEVQTCLQLN